MKKLFIILALFLLTIPQAATKPYIYPQRTVELTDMQVGERFILCDGQVLKLTKMDIFGTVAGGTIKYDLVQWPQVHVLFTRSTTYVPLMCGNTQCGIKEQTTLPNFFQCREGETFYINPETLLYTFEIEEVGYGYIIFVRIR